MGDQVRDANAKLRVDRLYDALRISNKMADQVEPSDTSRLWTNADGSSQCLGPQAFRLVIEAVAMSSSSSAMVACPEQMNGSSVAFS